MDGDAVLASFVLKGDRIELTFDKYYAQLGLGWVVLGDVVQDDGPLHLLGLLGVRRLRPVQAARRVFAPVLGLIRLGHLAEERVHIAQLLSRNS